MLPGIPLKSKSIIDYYIFKYKNIPKIPKKPIINEELGKTFEMAICMLYNINYIGSFKYNIRNAKSLLVKLSKLREYVYVLNHLGGKNENDFKTNIGFLNAKTTRSDGKVCPQVIGQPCLKSFCNYFSCEPKDIKNYIVTNIDILLREYFKNTFSQPIIYYNEKNNRILLIERKSQIKWDKKLLNFSHIKINKEWKESTTLYYDKKPLGEFQIHKNRDCIKFRWKFENLLK